jgi:UDP-N-acetylglucosamine--N-acetylmuramyl-(pentapeptide) pyrophosphoryl-undecaprenol N-acetylglucosamine transferase
MEYRSKKILLTGGGTGGSVTPLLAITEELISDFPASPSQSQVERFTVSNFLWLGTRSGVEREMVAKLKIPYQSISYGKLRRYWSWRNFIDPVFILLGFFQSLLILSKWKPNLVVSAGSFISVPVVWAAWVWRIPILIHQQDVRKGFANKLMSPFADVVTVTFEKSLKDYGKKAVWTGNPVRKIIVQSDFNVAQIKKESNLKNDLPILLVVGGGTGALAINKIVVQCLKELTNFCQVIHITGVGKRIGQAPSFPNYYQFDFLEVERMAKVLRVADIVVSRCGMNLLSELSYLSKAAILIPIPNSHQEENAEIFYHAKAAVVLDQDELTSEKFTYAVKKLINNLKLRDSLKININKVLKGDANLEIIVLINKLLANG